METFLAVKRRPRFPVRMGTIIGAFVKVSPPYLAGDLAKRSQIVFKQLERNEIFYITEGYLFPNGYYATKEDEKAMYYHELGHQKYNKCIHFPDMLETTPFCICESEFKEKAGILGEDLRQKAIDKLKKMIDEQSDLFHSNYGEDGYATSYNCPN